MNIYRRFLLNSISRQEGFAIAKQQNKLSRHISKHSISQYCCWVCTKKTYIQCSTFQYFQPPNSDTSKCQSSTSRGFTGIALPQFPIVLLLTACVETMNSTYQVITSSARFWKPNDFHLWKICKKNSDSRVGRSLFLMMAWEKLVLSIILLSVPKFRTVKTIHVLSILKLSQIFIPILLMLI